MRGFLFYIFITSFIFLIKVFKIFLYEISFKVFNFFFVLLSFFRYGEYEG